MSDLNDATVDDILYDAAVALRDHDYISLAEGLERVRHESGHIRAATAFGGGEPAYQLHREPVRRPQGQK